MPTNFTGAKKLAARAAYEAEPPNKSACSSTGVLTVSSAMEPTMRTDMGIWTLDFRFSIQEHLGGTSVFRNVSRLEQTGNNNDALRACFDDFCQIVQFDSTDAEDWDANGIVNLS